MTMPPSSLAAGLIRSADHTVALTGAGISTPSGIPDFRSAGSGLWEKNDPFIVASLTSFRYDPKTFYQWFEDLAKLIYHANPNPAHQALAQLETAGYLHAIVTQNIDGLHQSAGSQSVYELHGHLRGATCIHCFRPHTGLTHFERFVSEGAIPQCEDCGSYLKPDVVLMGEQLPHEVVQKAQGEFEKADLVLVGGSSLEVTPAALFPLASLRRGAKLIIINRDPTYLDERAELTIRADIAEALPEIASEVLDE